MAIGQTCSPDPLLPKAATLSLMPADVGTTELWLRFVVTGSGNNSTIEISRVTHSGRQVIFSRTASSMDTVIHDQSLLPNTSYRYVALQKGYGTIPIDSSSVMITTLDSSSHTLTFSTDTLGDGSSSILSDVFILNDSLVLAVGEIGIRDSTGVFGRAYGLAVHRGAGWELVRLISNSPISPNTNLRPRGIFAFSPTDVWFAHGGVHHWDGVTVTSYWINSFTGNPGAILQPGQTAEKIWGRSSSDLYAVGRGGAIAHFDGGRWKAINSGTTTDINDIHGVSIGDETFVLCTVSNPFGPGDQKLLRISAQGTVIELAGPPPSRLHSVWFDRGQRIVVTGGGVYSGVPGAWSPIDKLAWPPYTTHVRGSGLNNIFVVGNDGLVGHYNGISWMLYPESFSDHTSYRSVAVTPRKAVAVGWVGDRAIALTIVK